MILEVKDTLNERLIAPLKPYSHAAPCNCIIKLNVHIISCLSQ